MKLIRLRRLAKFAALGIGAFLLLGVVVARPYCRLFAVAVDEVLVNESALFRR